MSNDKLNQVLRKQQKQKDEPRKKDTEDIVQLVGFVVNDEEFAVPILSIQEIIKPIEFTRVPSVPDYVLGVFNLRGNVIPLIDLRKKFKIPNPKNSDETRYIVMKHADNVAGFVIDRLTEAIRMPTSKIDPPPETLHEDMNLIYGIGKREHNILTILKVDAILKRDF